MKKIFILALTFLMLSVLPAFAADTEVYMAGTHNISEDLLITIKTEREDFEGATIKIGEKVTYDFEAYGKGKHTANVPLSGIDRAGDETVTVMAKFSGESETIEKTVSFFKMSETVTKYTRANIWLHNVSAGWSGGNGDTTAYNLDENGNKTDDTGLLLFKWKDQDPFKAGDTRFGLQAGTGANQAEGIYYVEHDLYFIYGDGGKVALPTGARFSNYYRTETNTSGYPQYTDGRKWDDRNIATVIDGSTGMLVDGTQLYTNTWYRIRIVIDKYTKDETGNYTGGLKYYIAEADEEGNFGDYRLFVNYEKVYMTGICGWRYEFKAPNADFSFAVKNFKFTFLEPQGAWYLTNTQFGDNSIKLTFSEDMGDVNVADFKIYNKLNSDADGNVIFEEIPISAVAPSGENEYEIKLPKSLLYGKAYEIRLANNFKSATGAIGFKEPSADDNGDGFWSFSDITAPKYPLNIEHISDEGNASIVKINNSEIENKYIIVCWYNEEGAMVDHKLKHFVGLPDNDTFTFERKNSKAYSELKAYVFDLNADPESEESGKVTVYDSK